ncbi:MAG: ribonuclease P protein component [Bacteroidales bacterium]|jgi:ribonuclease P protein component|nr:ribonuclease P protein component [Bacteroidales bacterium]
MSEQKQNLSLKRSSFLKLKTDIQLLFDKGKRINQGEIKVIYLKEANPDEKGFKVFVSAPKRLLRHATQRNRAKRQLREAIRLNCTDLRDLCAENDISLFFGVIYSSQSSLKYNIIEQKIVISLQKIYNEIYEDLQKNKPII